MMQSVVASLERTNGSKGIVDSLIQGELLLYTTNSQNHSQNDSRSSPVHIGVIQSWDAKTIFFSDRNLGLHAERVEITSGERKLFHVLPSYGSVLIDHVVEYVSGKDEIINHLSRRDELKHHVDWISRLSVPYRLPTPKTISFVELK